ncbi:MULTISPECIES: NUDIX hydrolase [unclassified Arthrobacter]|uniref:NUDIX hydrolase n=1 Tax=unclassified Arthrobacter TaxID=235627 RepID=UPI00159E2F07|nr:MULTISPECIES: NUDIX hydrolase [unclassified Arthrobacter]MCQ9165708.1 NUDIX hydrolase [Arthrobacter sp. STN4]NVN00352.1 NUDIX hydrolase [Arthrobacter sp. SDTb3-6]
MPNFSNAPAGPRPAGKRIFPLNADQREAAQAWVDFGERTPSKPRSASSVVLLKDSPGGLQTFMTYRPGNSPLGLVAFPGGTVEPADDDVTDWAGPSPAQWAKSMGAPDAETAKRHVVAAIRELFEEAGILLAGPDASSLVEAVSGPEWMKERESIAAQDSTFSGLLERRGLVLRTDLLKPLSHWLSPDFAHRRFDTRYFAAAAPVNQEPQLLASKGVWGRWVCAADLLADRAGSALGDEIGQENTVGLRLGELVVPGVEIILEKLGAARGCIAYLNHKRPVNEYQPALVTEEDGTFELEVQAAPASEGAACRER